MARRHRSLRRRGIRRPRAARCRGGRPDGSRRMIERPRRLRTTPAMRRLVAETRLHPADLILPVFIREGATAPVPITAMPGVMQHTTDSLRRAIAGAADA